MIQEPLLLFTGKKPLLLLLVLSLNGLSLGFFLSAEATAGGYDEPSTSDAFDPVPYAEDQTYSPYASPYEASPSAPSRNQPTTANARSLNALNSSASYSQDDGVCRETSGDIICLSPSLARNLNW